MITTAVVLALSLFQLETVAVVTVTMVMVGIVYVVDQCGISTPTGTTTKIVGGTTAKAGEFPWQVTPRPYCVSCQVQTNFRPIKLKLSSIIGRF